MTPDGYTLFFAIMAALGIGLYVILDGFDLGVGILFPFAPRSADRDMMITSLAPIWDGNETWLVLGGMVLLAGFPVAFSILLPAFYVPLALMLFGLVLRGVAFEFRSQSGASRLAWSAAFAGGSLLAAICQGAVLGSLISSRIAVVDGRFAGGPFDWVGLFPMAVGVGLAAGYAVLGAGWLIWRTEGATQTFAREIARPALLVTAAALLLVGAWTPFALSSIWTRWFSWPNPLFLAPLPLGSVIAWALTWRNLWHAQHWRPFASAVCIFIFALAGIGVSVWPDAIPGVLPLADAVSAPRTQRIVAWLLVGIVPVILGYVGYAYWVFRGKVQLEGEGKAPTQGEVQKGGGISAA
ncbi:cytochrome bd-I ubiquinol oxidase subunit 2 apoprotein [Sphingobium sp. AP50]|uniref:cytochrome d ubiquinol oxidase subunit II n=1 Tax=Sphingobium sp. AP50 TaxID=1884369 RepID=UPI0008BAA068|nr:cytochrome d ubiquinol oxidase subunit II [Sphingobium sp. AP50]SEJ81620.1 cytochrome bd-I ubiquinol oxidase subunit 2 apoprotein [Sphingobium sp. AP50]